jgi:F-type H+-transporting ATPase subunit delta
MPVQIDALATVYARSLFELAEKAGGPDKITEIAGELEQICELMRADRKIREFFSSPIVDAEARSASLNRIFSNRVTDITLRFLLVLNQKGRLNVLENIASAYDRLVQEAFGRVEVDVFTATPMEREQLQTLHERIRNALDREPVLHPYTDPTMIGGLKLRIGDQLIDGSVANKLRRMKHELLTDGAGKLRDHLARFIEEGGSS